MTKGGWRQDAQFCSVHMLIDGKNQIDATNKGPFAIFGSQSMTCIVQCIHGGRAGRIDCEAARNVMIRQEQIIEEKIEIELPRTLEIEDVTNTVTDDARINTSSCIAVTEIRFLEGHLLIVGCEATDKDCSVCSRDLSIEC